MKKTYYSAKVIRFVYDPSSGGKLGVNMHDAWGKTLSEQGFAGDLIFSPKVKGLEMLKDEFVPLDKAVQAYNSGAA